MELVRAPLPPDVTDSISEIPYEALANALGSTVEQLQEDSISLMSVESGMLNKSPETIVRLRNQDLSVRLQSDDLVSGGMKSHLAAVYMANPGGTIPELVVILGTRSPAETPLHNQEWEILAEVAEENNGHLTVRSHLDADTEFPIFELQREHASMTFTTSVNQWKIEASELLNYAA